MIVFLLLSLICALVAIALGYKGYDTEALIEKLLPHPEETYKHLPL